MNPVNAALTAYEVSFILRDCGADVLLATSDRLTALRSRDSLSGLCAVVALDGTDNHAAESFESLIETVRPILRRRM